jgi:hypothetical protein
MKVSMLDKKQTKTKRTESNILSRMSKNRPNVDPMQNIARVPLGQNPERDSKIRSIWHSAK